VAILDSPTTVFGKCQNVAFGVKEEKRLGRADGQAGVCPFAAAGDFGANLVLENLVVPGVLTSNFLFGRKC
jgi:hypothetical protein